jgi:hypothetical protein
LSGFSLAVPSHLSRLRHRRSRSITFNLDAALEVMWQGLVEDEQGGVTALVHHLSTQIETAVFQPVQAPLSPFILDPSSIF